MGALSNLLLETYSYVSFNSSQAKNLNLQLLCTGRPRIVLSKQVLEVRSRLWIIIASRIGSAEL